MNSYHISILGLSEVRWTGSGKFVTEGKTIIFSGRDDNIHREGVALLLDKSSSKALEEWMPVNERLMMARFKSRHAKVSIIQCYSPTNDYDDED